MATHQGLGMLVWGGVPQSLRGGLCCPRHPQLRAPMEPEARAPPWGQNSISGGLSRAGGGGQRSVTESPGGQPCLPLGLLELGPLTCGPFSYQH